MEYSNSDNAVTPASKTVITPAFLRRTAKAIIYRRIYLGHTSVREIYGQCTNFARVIKIYQGLIFNLLHLLVAAYRGVFRTWSNIYNAAFFAKILNDFKLLTIFAKKAPSQLFESTY